MSSNKPTDSTAICILVCNPLYVIGRPPFVHPKTVACNSTLITTPPAPSMTYRSRGRSITEVIIAVTFVGFLTGFVVVLCVGNFYRAKNAMERQKQRRLARLAGVNGLVESPRSHTSSSNSEQSSLLSRQTPAPSTQHSTMSSRGSRQQRQQHGAVSGTVLFDVEEHHVKQVMSV